MSPSTGDLLRSSFVGEGAALVQLTKPSISGLQALSEASAALFSLPDRRKERFSDPTTLVGWRNVGIEYSAIPERPDLMESLSYNPAYRQRLEDLGQESQERAWITSAHAAATILDRLMATLISELARAYGRSEIQHKDGSPFAKGSFVQINRYSASQMTRPVLQDAHEDGNLLTLLASNGPGLEVSLDGVDFRALTPPAGQIAAFPGRVLSLMSGGEISPTLHRVVRVPNVCERQSIMYFGNPSPGVRLQPWKGQEDPSSEAWSSPSRFGLPDIPPMS